MPRNHPPQHSRTQRFDQAVEDLDQVGPLAAAVELISGWQVHLAVSRLDVTRDVGERAALYRPSIVVTRSNRWRIETAPVSEVRLRSGPSNHARRAPGVIRVLVAAQRCQRRSSRIRRTWFRNCGTFVVTTSQSVSLSSPK